MTRLGEDSLCVVDWPHLRSLVLSAMPERLRFFRDPDNPTVVRLDDSWIQHIVLVVSAPPECMWRLSRAWAAVCAALPPALLRGFIGRPSTAKLINELESAVEHHGLTRRAVGLPTPLEAFALALDEP
jgi:hypothetical protein